MIKSVVDSHNWNEYIVSVPEVVSETVFCERARVRPNSYAWRLAARLYRDIFKKSLDIKHDFDAYYAVEYTSFADYLRKRHLLHEDEANDIAAVYKESAAIFRYRYPLSFVEDDPGEGLLAVLLKTRVDQ